jgi:transposase
MRAYSLDLRERVAQDVADGMTRAAVSKKYRVSTRWIYKLLRQQQETGDLAPLCGGGGPPRALAGREEELAKHVRETPDATLNELRARLQLPVSTVTVWRAVNRLGLTFKKSRACR